MHLKAPLKVKLEPVFTTFVKKKDCRYEYFLVYVDFAKFLVVDYRSNIFLKWCFSWGPIKDKVTPTQLGLIRVWL